MRRRHLGLLAGAAMVLFVPVGDVQAHATDPSGTYQWVSPPPERRDNNRPPKGAHMTRTAEDLAAVWTPDFQFRMTWTPEALSAEDEAVVDVTPLDAYQLAALPKGYQPNGNAYRVRVDSLDLAEHPAKVVLVVPSPGPVVYGSADGKTWARVPAVVNDRGQAEVELREDGLLVAAMRHEDSPPLISPARAWIVLGAAVIAYELWRRVRARRPAPVVGHRSTRSQPSRPKKKAKRRKR